MKKILLAGVAALFVVPAVAADLPTKKAVVIPVATEYNWTGIYFGAQPRLGLGQQQLQFVCLQRQSRHEHLLQRTVGRQRQQQRQLVHRRRPDRLSLHVPAALRDRRRSESRLDQRHSDTTASDRERQVLSRRPVLQRSWAARSSAIGGYAMGRFPPLHQGRLGLEQLDCHPHPTLRQDRRPGGAVARQPDGLPGQHDSQPERLDTSAPALPTTSGKTGKCSVSTCTQSTARRTSSISSLATPESVQRRLQLAHLRREPEVLNAARLPKRTNERAAPAALFFISPRARAGGRG